MTAVICIAGTGSLNVLCYEGNLLGEGEDSEEGVRQEGSGISTYRNLKQASTFMCAQLAQWYFKKLHKTQTRPHILTNRGSEREYHPAGFDSQHGGGC